MNKLSIEQKTELLNLYSSGKSIKDLADMCGFTYNAMYYLITNGLKSKLGIKIRFTSTHDNVIYQMVAKYPTNLTEGFEEAAKILKRDLRCIRDRWYKKPYGLKFKTQVMATLSPLNATPNVKNNPRGTVPAIQTVEISPDVRIPEQMDLWFGEICNTLGREIIYVLKDGI